MSLPARIVGGIRRDGLRRVLGRSWRRVRSAAYLREAHVWYALEMSGERPRRALDAAFELVTPGEEGIPLLAGLNTVSVGEAVARLDAGATLWMVRADGRAAFSCWTFPARTPVIAASGGWLELPPGISCLEDSVTSPEYRGRGVAPAAWSTLSDRLLEQGVRTLVTKVEVDNAPSRRAVEKAGFREVAVMRFRRTGPRERVEVDADDDATGVELARALRR